MAKRRRLDLMPENFARMEPQGPLSLADYVTNVTDDDTHSHSRKKAKKSKRKRDNYDVEQQQQPQRRLVHTLSDSNDSADFVGYDSDLSPVFNRQRNNKQLPSWLNQNTPPGPWQTQSARATTPMPGSDDDGDFDNVDTNEAPIPPQQNPTHEVMHTKRSLEDFMNILGADQDVAPNVWPNVAVLVEKTWNVPHKEDIKAIYTSHKRPGNTPSLEKVSLDDEIATGLAERFPAAKRNDAALSLVGNALVKSAICLTDIINTSMTDMSAEDAAKKTMAASFDALRILSYANAQLLGTRRHMLKYVLDPNLRQPLCKDASLESTNNSHQLFGGDMQKKAKEGAFSFIIF